MEVCIRCGDWRKPSLLPAGLRDFWPCLAGNQLAGGRELENFQSISGKAALEANLPVMDSESDCPHIMRWWHLQLILETRATNSLDSHQLGLLLPKLLSVFTPSLLHLYDYALWAISHPDTVLWQCILDFLICDCSLFSGSQSSSVSNNSTLPQDGAWLQYSEIRGVTTWIWDIPPCLPVRNILMLAFYYVLPL